MHIDSIPLGRGARCPISAASLKRIVKRTITTVAAQQGLSRREVEQTQLAFVFANRDQALRLNTQYRAKPYSPNVLTFANRQAPVQADIILCMPVIREQAKQHGKSWQDHLSHMIVHGVLHAFGWDHEKAAQALRMERLEGAILAGLGVSDPYDSGGKIARLPRIR